MKKIINNTHKTYPKSPNTTWWRLPEEVKDLEDRTTSVENRDLSDFKNESQNKFLRQLDISKIDFGFKSGSVGEKVSFTKVSGSNPNTFKDVIIPGKLEITRGNGGGGIFNIALETNYNSSNNSPENTFWNTQYVDSTNVNWAPLWDLENRSYTDWRNAVQLPSGNNAPPQYVGTPAVMQWDNGVDPVRYWLIMFTHWGANGEEYSFSYDRYEILPAVSFEQPSTDNTNTPNVIDIISDGVHLTRRYTGGGLYNTVEESYAINGASPLNTKWNSSFTDSRAGYSGYTDLSNLESRVYTDFYSALDGEIGNNLPGTELIMHDITTDLYYKIDFTEWAQGCDGGLGNITSYNTLGFGAGYPDGGWHALYGVGGSGTGFGLQVLVTGGVVTNISSWKSGKNYQVGDVLVFPYPGIDVIAPLTIEVTEVCSMGGFAYTRTVIPQSYGIKFADGTVMNTAVTSTGGAIGNDFVYTQGLISPEVESDFIRLSDTITTADTTGYVVGWGPSSASGSWIVGNYVVSTTGGSGFGCIVNINIDGSGSYSAGITNGGSNYVAGDTITFSAGGTDFTFEEIEVTNISGISLNTYKLRGIAKFTDTGSSLYSYLIGVISGDSNLKLVNDATTISAPVNVFDNVSSKFSVNAYVRDSSSGNAVPLSTAIISLDNTIAGSNDYFISIIATSSYNWTGTAYIDIEFASDQLLSYYN